MKSDWTTFPSLVKVVLLPRARGQRLLAGDKMTLLLSLIFLVSASSGVQATDRYVVPSGGLSSGTCSITTPCTVAFAMSGGGPTQPGDTIWLNDGTYTTALGTGKHGTPGNLITIRAVNKHKAVLSVGPGLTCGTNDIGRLHAAHNYWAVKDLRFENMRSGIWMNQLNIGWVIEDNLFYNFTYSGVHMRRLNQNHTIRNNVFGIGARCDDISAAIAISWGDSAQHDGSDNNLAETNIIYGMGNNGDQAGAFKLGYAFIVDEGSQNNTLRGNIFFGNGGKGGLRMLSSFAPPFNVTGNVFRDNAIMFQDAAAGDTSDATDDSNSFINNLAIGVYFSSFGTKGNITPATYGHHTWEHNTVIKTPWSWLGFSSGCANGGCKINNVLKNNLFYATHAQAGSSNTLLRVEAQNTEFPAALNAGYNLFASPGFTNMFNNYTPRANDISNQPPVFNDAANCDYTLAPGSPGKNAASDGTDIGIAYNQYLVKARIAQVCGLPTQENTGLTGVTSTSFTVSPNHYYDVTFFIPQSSSCNQTAEQFTIEGVGGNELLRNITTIASGWVLGANQRWYILGKHKAIDGTLNISWQHNNCVERVHVRKLPTADEAYAWLNPTAPIPPTPPVPSVPTNLTVSTTINGN